MSQSNQASGQAGNVSVLYVDPRGPYPSLVSDWWDEKRDARRYAGPNPVVAHPPCQLWTNLARVNFKRYGGEHNRPGNDGGCFLRALQCVDAYGGVLEHPAGSYAWAAYGLSKPERGCWSACAAGWCCEVAQSAYGHQARKLTWLYYVGERLPVELDWSVPEGTHQCGWFDRKKPTLGKREASATPLPFARLLLELAANAR